MKEYYQCKRVISKGLQCKKKALPGSNYCLIHQPREIWLPAIITIAVTLIFSVLITVLITSNFSRRSFKKELNLIHLSRPRIVPAVGGFPVVIDNGITVIIDQPGFVTHKMEEGPFDYRIADDGAIKIYGEIKSIDGSLIVVATGDYIRVLPNTGFDINSDSKACEIVDSDKNVIYQISVVSLDQWKKDKDEATSRVSLLSRANEVIKMNYVHCIDGNWWCVTGEGSQLVHSYENMKEWQSKIPRLFKYPGDKYPGIRIGNKIS